MTGADTPAKKGYRARTVIAAQRRVLNMAFAVLSRTLTTDTLYTDGSGLMTGGELLAHIDAARKLKVRHD